MSTKEQVEAARELRERVEQDYAEAWDFREIPTIVGVVESYAEVNTQNGVRVVCTIRELEPPEQRYAVWLSQTALLARFRELKPAEGELVAIRYLGQSEHAERGQSPAHRFRVEVKRTGQTFDWGRYGGDETGVNATPEGADPGDYTVVSDDALERAIAADHDEIPF